MKQPYKVQNRTSESRRVKFVKNGGTVSFPKTPTASFVENSREAGFCLTAITPLPSRENPTNTITLTSHPMGTDGRVSLFINDTLIESKRFLNKSRITDRQAWFNSEFGAYATYSGKEFATFTTALVSPDTYRFVFEDDDLDYVFAGTTNASGDVNPTLIVEQYRLAFNIMNNKIEISCDGAKVESEEIVLDGDVWAVEIDGVVVELPSTFAITSSSTVTYEAMVTLLEEHGIRVTELKNAVTHPIYCDGAISTESCKMQDGGWMLEVDGVDMGGPYDLASLDEYSRRREVRIFVTPPLVKFENVSTTEHHTVRLTPVNGETVDPTTLVGAALWSDDLVMCLAPPPKDETCYGTTEAAYITTMPMTVDQIGVVINDVDYGLLVDENSDIITYEVLADNTLVITNTTTECIRVVLGAPIENGIINGESLIFAEDKPEPYFAFLSETEQLNGVTIHLAPSRIGQIAIDSFYRVDGATDNTAIFGGRTIEFVLKTSSLLPAAGLNFNLDGQVYHMAYGATELSIPYEIATNTTRYPRTVTPVLTIEEPQYLLGEALPSISSMTVKPQGFNYSIDVTIQGQYVNITRQTSASEPNVSFYVGNRNDIHLGHGDVEYTVKFDASFAGAELRCYPNYAMNELLGVLDSTGSCTFKTPWHWTLRKEQDLGLRLHDAGNPDPFFSIWSIYAYGTQPFIYSDTLGSMKEVTGRLSSGFGNELTITGIPNTILEIEISNDRWGHAGNAATPFATPKRVTRADGSVPFKVTPDKPTMLYSSSAGTMLYYLNYIQVMFVKDGEVSKQGQWFEYKLNVIA